MLFGIESPNLLIHSCDYKSYLDTILDGITKITIMIYLKKFQSFFDHLSTFIELKLSFFSIYYSILNKNWYLQF